MMLPHIGHLGWLLLACALPGERSSCGDSVAIAHLSTRSCMRCPASEAVFSDRKEKRKLLEKNTWASMRGKDSWTVTFRSSFIILREVLVH